MLTLLLAWLAPAGAQDTDAPWYVGETVALVTLDSEAGDLPEDNLVHLLDVRPGQSLSVGDVRHDIKVLMRAGQFASVEAHAELWPLSETETGVWIRYYIVSPPQIRRVKISSPSSLPRQLVRDTLTLTRGAPFFVEEQAPLIETELEALLSDAGWPDAEVSLIPQDIEPGIIDLHVDVLPGAVRRYREVHFIGDTGLPEQLLRRQLRRNGIAAGRRVDRRRRVEAREVLRDSLIKGRSVPLQPRRQWLQGRVSFIHDIQPEGDVLNVIIDAGPGVEIDSRGRGAPRSAEAAEALQLFAGERVTASRSPEMTRALSSWFHADGYRTPTIAELSVNETEWGHRITVRAEQGPVHRLRRIEVSGASAFTEAYLASALREAAPDSLRRGFVTDDGIQRALRGVEEFYRGQGFLDAEVSLADEERSSSGRVLRELSVDVSLNVQVSEGPRTWLRSLEVHGGHGLEAALIESMQQEMIGEIADPELRRPLIRARLGSLQRQIVDKYRSAGYLNADVRLEITESIHESGLRIADAVLHVEHEEQIMLRSIIVQGNLRTRRDVIIRELALEEGEPVTPEGLTQSRQQLYNLDLFRVVSPELIGDESRERDLIVHLEERPSFLLEGGAGVSSDQGIRMTGRATHRNLGGLGWRLMGLGQIGYGWFADSFVPEFSEPVGRAAIRYEANGFPSSGQKIIVEALINETMQEPAFRLSQRGLSLRMQIASRDGLQAVFDYRAQWRQLEDVDPGVLVVQDPWYEIIDDPYSPTLPSPWRFQGGPGVQLLFDRRNDRFNPTRGGYALGRAEMSDALTSQLLFFRLSSRAEMLLPLRVSTLRFGYQLGTGIVGNGKTLPLENRFFLGGSDSLRGFALNTVGPANRTVRPEIDYPNQIDGLLDATTLRESGTQWSYTGGDSLLAGTIEFRTPLSALGLEGWDTSQLVLFCDVGQVWFRDSGISTAFGEFIEDGPRVRVGTGAGIRLATPIGPASLELGINPDRISSREEPRFVPHISIGAL